MVHVDMSELLQIWERSHLPHRHNPVYADSHPRESEQRKLEAMTQHPGNPGSRVLELLPQTRSSS